MKCICNYKGCGREFELDSTKSSEIVCPVGHLLGFWIGTETAHLDMEGCHFDNVMISSRDGDREGR